MAFVETLTKNFSGWVIFCCCCCVPLLLTSPLPLKGKGVASTTPRGCKLSKTHFQPPYIRNVTYTLAKMAKASDHDTDNRFIGQQLFVNIKENNRCYMMKRVVEIVVKDVLAEAKKLYPNAEKVAEFFARLTKEELRSCNSSGHKEPIEKNLGEMKNKMKQLGDNGKTKAIGELDLLFDYTEDACTDAPKRGGNKKKN
ncbi:interleukin-22 [Calypte anna]|uniref:Interleukin-22 n=1 Tax=Calypte anna TaxID=9244 RepID=A0A091IK75_CALAN|nr:interleukin-22 [Calypte anna]KFP08692.1 Interleukin-22 [Calypte anna]